MSECKHECQECGEKWNCNFPTYSEHQHYEEVIEMGYYCNSFCPNCNSEKRKDTEDIFEKLQTTGYVKNKINR